MWEEYASEGQNDSFFYMQVFQAHEVTINTDFRKREIPSHFYVDLTNSSVGYHQYPYGLVRKRNVQKSSDKHMKEV
jgi:hypothetical protein